MAAGVGPAARAVDEVCTHEALDRAEGINVRTLDAIDAVITEFDLPAHTVGLGIKGCITWSTTPVRNYRDYKRTDFGVAELSWLWGVNRGILTPPGAVAGLAGPHPRGHGRARQRFPRTRRGAARLSPHCTAAALPR